MRMEALVVAIGLAACAPVSVSDVDPCNTTYCLTPYVSVQATVDRLAVSASFWDERSVIITSTPTPTSLDDDDRLTLSLGDASVDLVLAETGDSAGEYQASLPLAAPLQAGDVIAVAVTRTLSTSAVITMMAPAAVVVESVPDSVSRTSDVVLALNKPTIDDRLAITATGNGCISDGVISDRDESRSGGVTIARSEFVTDASLTCDVTLHFERSLPAQIDEPFWPPGNLPNLVVTTIAEATFTSTP